MPTKNNLELIAEHHLVKIVTPLLLIAVVSSVTYLFSSVIDLKNQMILVESKEVSIEEQLNDLDEDIESMRMLITDLRINLGSRRQDQN